MLDLLKKGVGIFCMVTAFIISGGNSFAENQLDYAYFVNGGFETGDYTGWNLVEVGAPTSGTWGIATAGEVINKFQQTYDFCDQILVRQFAACLPRTYAPTEGNYLSYQLQNFRQNARMYQDINLPQNATAISWNMSYTNLADAFYANQYLAVHIRDINDTILDTLFMTIPGSPMDLPTTKVSYDISMYAGKTIRFDIELMTQVNSIPCTFDNFNVERSEVTTMPKTTVPPGWGKSNKPGWQGEIPPGLDKQDKTPAGFANEKGKKQGWQKEL